ncbi:MAG: RNA polymerase-binding protein DksA [Gammaproteobacteria bacterium]|nr:RNA polymerase-binding protein DksA [Gammaproteobacteria bacterium]
MAVKKKRSSSTTAGRSAAGKTKPAARKPAASTSKRSPATKAPAKAAAKASTTQKVAAKKAKAPVKAKAPAKAKTPAKAASRRTAAAKPAATKKTAARAAKPSGATAKRPAASKTSKVRSSATTRAASTRSTATTIASGTVGLIHGIPPYQPRAGESYMNDRQREHFRHILLAWKRELMEGVDRTVHHMQDEASNFPDPNDRATQESEFGLELRTRDRERKLLKKIDSALGRIEDGSYGYCEETGEEIGLKRLEARPVATLSVEAQERREVAERQYRDRDDGF